MRKQSRQEHALLTGEPRIGGRLVSPVAIRRTMLLRVEGECHDICAIGQSLAAQNLARSPRPCLRTHPVRPTTGHYGVFSCQRWQRPIYPVVRDLMHVAQ